MATSELGHPCRLFVYLAGDAPLGVVLRRGPSDWVRLSLWHTDSDLFVHGQWMRARVYERRCDISPDGTLFVAFVRGAAGPRDGNADTWVAISRPPWFSALAVWFVGGTYYPGGLFRDRTTLGVGWSDIRPDQGTLPGWLHLTPALPPYLDRTNDWPDRTTWINRLLRVGWRRVDGVLPERWERSHPASPDTLAMVIHSNLEFGAYGGRYVIEYLVRNAPAGEQSLGHATWADWDQHGRLVLARHGRLYHVESPARQLILADFNDQEPDPHPPPPQATEWPRP